MDTKLKFIDVEGDAHTLGVQAVNNSCAAPILRDKHKLIRSLTHACH